VMPSPVSGNTQAAAFVIGAKAAELILADAS
jgi:choline dehydrogenase-like flavoprotein